MEENESQKRLIDFLQNPSKHFLGDLDKLYQSHRIGVETEDKWISFEDKYSIENYSGLTGKGVYELALALSVINMQAGVNSRYIDRLEKIPKDKLIRIYYRHLKERQNSYSKNVFSIVCHWMKNNSYISELELNRLLRYETVENFEEPLDDINHEILKNELMSYAENYWIETE